VSDGWVYQYKRKDWVFPICEGCNCDAMVIRSHQKMRVWTREIGAGVFSPR
jgi:hypothetical protein